MSDNLKLCDEVKIPIDALTQPWALMGNRGGGKTYGGMKIFEIAYDADVQCGVIDVAGKWWGLRLGANGKPHDGLKNVYIFGGKHADFPLQEDKGAFIAKLVVEKRIHFDLDLSLMRKGARKRFLADFLDEIYHLKQAEDVPTPLLLFWEEAHAICPQKPRPEEARMLGAAEDIVREGRNYGIGVVLMDQRPATVNKDVLALVEVVIALRITWESDRQTIKDWLIEKEVTIGTNIKDMLPFFKNGKGFLWAPVYELFRQIQILPKRTYDSTASVKIGVARKAVGALSPVDVESVKGAMTAVIAEAEANDPRALHRKIADLERIIRDKKPLEVTAEKIVEKRVEVPVVTDQQIKRLEAMLEKALGLGNKVSEWCGEVTHGLSDLLRATSKIRSAPPPLPPARPVSAASAGAALQKMADKVTRERAASATVHNGEPVEPKAQKMLDIVASFHPKPITRRQLCTLSAYSNVRNGSFLTNISVLFTRGLIVKPGGDIALTEEAVRLYGNRMPLPPTGEELQEIWRGRLEPKVWAMFEEIKARGKIDRQTLVEAMGYTNVRNGSFLTNISVLSTNGLIVKDKNFVEVSDLIVNGVRAAA